MTTAPHWSSIVASAASRRNMRSRTDLGEPGRAFWEVRNLNMHRVVGFPRVERSFADAHGLDAEIRSVLSRNFKRSWWRGIAYGVVASVGTLSLTPDDLRILIDVRENAKGTLQWVILVTSDGREAIGVHTWVEGYLSSVYRAILRALAERGCQITSAMKEKDELMRVLTAVADGRAAALNRQAGVS